MSKKTQAWGWKWLQEGHRRRWPYFVTRALNDIGNYGIRGTVRERVLRGIGFWLRNNVIWKLGLHKVLPCIRRKRGLPFAPSELRYSQRARCRCGAGLAYWPDGFWLRPAPAESTGWVCADVLTGKIPTEGIRDCTVPALGLAPASGVIQHHYLPFSFFEVRSEDQPNSSGIRRKVLGGLLGERYSSCREVGDSTRFSRDMR